MNLQQYVRQVKPRNESHILPVDKVQSFLFEEIDLPKEVFGNLPYNISVTLIFKILKLDIHISELILMIQKEVAEKMVYSNNNKKNRLNCFIKIAAKYKIEFNVNKKVFYPKPKINSSVVKIIPIKNLNVNLYEFENFSRKFFNYKRKKISYYFKKNKLSFDKINKEILNKRAEDLKLEEILIIFNKYYNY